MDDASHCNVDKRTSRRRSTCCHKSIGLLYWASSGFVANANGVNTISGSGTSRDVVTANGTVIGRGRGSNGEGVKLFAADRMYARRSRAEFHIPWATPSSNL